MDAADRFVDWLEMQEATDRSAEVMLDTLRGVGEAGLLWEIAERVSSSSAIMQAVYRRALELDAGEETARGYVAQSYFLNGDEEKAASLLEPEPERSRDPVVLSVWAALGTTSGEVISRLETGLERAPDSLRLWRQYATETLRSGLMLQACEAHRWLVRHEENPSERQRVADIIEKHRW